MREDVVHRNGFVRPDVTNARKWTEIMHFNIHEKEHVVTLSRTCMISILYTYRDF